MVLEVALLHLIVQELPEPDTPLVVAASNLARAVPIRPDGSGRSQERPAMAAQEPFQPTSVRHRFGLR